MSAYVDFLMWHIKINYLTWNLSFVSLSSFKHLKYKIIKSREARHMYFMFIV